MFPPSSINYLFGSADLYWFILVVRVPVRSCYVSLLTFFLVTSTWISASVHNWERKTPPWPLYSLSFLSLVFQSAWLFWWGGLAQLFLSGEVGRRVPDLLVTPPASWLWQASDWAKERNSKRAQQEQREYATFKDEIHGDWTGTEGLGKLSKNTKIQISTNDCFFLYLFWKE